MRKTYLLLRFFLLVLALLAQAFRYASTRTSMKVAFSPLQAFSGADGPFETTQDDGKATRFLHNVNAVRAICESSRLDIRTFRYLNIYKSKDHLHK